MSEVDRRRFLRVAGSVVATVAASASTVRAVAKPIRVGVFGTQHGHVNSKMRALRANSDYEVVAVHEPDEGARKKRQSEKLFEGLKFIAEDDLLGDNSLDLIMVEGRVWQAIPWGNKVIDAGRHLHLEKPPSPDLEPFRQLIEKAKRKKLLLQQGYNYRYHPCIRAAIEATKKGWLGDAYLLRATMNSNRSKQGRTIEAKYPGGAFFELCGHMVDRAVELWGRPLKTTGFLR